MKINTFSEIHQKLSSQGKNAILTPGETGECREYKSVYWKQKLLEPGTSGKEVLILATIQMNPESVIHSERSQVTKDHTLHDSLDMKYPE